MVVYRDQAILSACWTWTNMKQIGRNKDVVLEHTATDILDDQKKKTKQNSERNCRVKKKLLKTIKKKKKPIKIL